MSVAIGKKMSGSREETFARMSSRDWPSEVHTLDDLKGQVALVTGASRGIGATVAAELDALGAIVYGGMRRLNAVDGLKPILLDVTQEATVSAAIAQIQHEVGRMDVLVNSAGVGVSDGDLAEVSTAEIRTVLETNLLGPMLVSKHALPLLLKRRGGRIVNVSSLVGAVTGGMEGNYPAYRVSKTGLNGLTVYLHGEYEPQGLIANSVCPGHTRTDLGGPDAERSVEEGAETPVWLATFAPGGPGGLFWRDKKVIPW